MPLERPPARLPYAALCLAMTTALSAGVACRPAPALEDPNSAEGDASGGAERRSDAAAVAGKGQLEPAAEQVAAGIPHLRFQVPVGQAPRRGPADAPVTMVMFSDFECPFCAKALRLVESLEREYPGQIRFVYKAFPIDRHPYAVLAALVAHSAQAQGKFWEFHDMLFSGQRLDEKVITQYAERAGLDLSQVDEDLANFAHGAELRRDLRQGKRLDVRSTPTIFVNGRPLVGAQPIEAFRTVVDQELSLAAKWRDEGVAADEVYEHATRLAYARVVYEGDDRLDEDSVYPVPIAGAPARGPADAKLTVVAFTDFRCPFCVRGNETLDKLVDDYRQDIRVVYKYLPLQGPMASSAALGAWAAGQQGKFWEFHDALYAHGHRFSIPDLELIAMRLELDMERWYADLDSPQAKKEIRKDIELARKLGISGTPTYFVNGRPLDGARPEIEFHLLFAEELERAEAKLAAGTQVQDLYGELAGLNED